MIWFKIFLLFLSCFLFRGIWARSVDFWVRKSIPEKPTLKMLTCAKLQQLLQPSLDYALQIPWLQMRAKENSKQVWLVRLAYSPISGFLVLILIWFWVYFLGLRGIFAELNHVQNMATPPEWSIWIGDQSPQTFALMSLFAMITTLIFRKPFFNVAIVGVFLFSGLISIAGGVVMLLAERWAQRLFFRVKFRLEMVRNEVTWSLIISGILLAASIVWGRVLVAWISSLGLGFENTFHPADRFELLTLTLLLWCSIETVVSMVFYHFYWLKYRQP